MKMEPMPTKLDWRSVREIYLDPRGKSWIRVYDRKRQKYINYRVSRWVAQLAKDESKNATDGLKGQLRALLGTQQL